MKKLLFKELRLCLNPQVIIFMCLSILVVIPSLPTLTAFIYTFMAFVIIFPLAIANRDIEFTALLPIRKVDIVKGKVLLASFIELASIVISIPFGLLKIFVINPSMAAGPEPQMADLGVNLVLYGIVLTVCGIFNLIFIPMYYKNPYKTAKSQLFATFIIIVVTMATAILFTIFPEAATFVNTFHGIALLVQFTALAFGIGIFLLFNYLAFRLGAKKIQAIDL